VRLFSCLFMVCTSIGLGLAQRADSQESEDRRVTYVEVAPSVTEQAANLLTSYAEASLGAPGNQFFQVLKRIGRANHFVILETWDSADTQASHSDSGYAVQFRNTLEPLLLSPPDSRPYGDLFAADGADIGPDGIFVVTHVDVMPPNTDASVALLNNLVSPSRNEPGNRRFEVWFLIGHANHMTMVEAWESADAWERHASASHTREFRGSMSPLNGALYDERLYRAI
jgi:quinol monooxygenase YgiN